MTARIWLRRVAAVLVVLAVVVVAAILLAPGRVLDAELARRQWRAGLVAHDIDVGGQHWRYYTRGSADADAVVLIHGLQGDASNWFDVLANAPDTRRYLVPDLPGFGASPTPADRDFRPAIQAARLAAFLDAVGVSRADVVGHSMGGFIVGHFTAAHPARVRTIAFVDAAGVPFDANDFSRALERGDNPYLVRNRADFDRFLDQVFAHRSFLPAPVRNALADRVIPHADDWDLAMRTLSAPDQRYGLVSVLPSITAPALVLWCRNDPVLDVSSVRAFADGLPNEQVVLLDGCGHMPVMEQPRATADALARLWRSVYAAN